jgi:hypothetical protein
MNEIYQNKTIRNYSQKDIKNAKLDSLCYLKEGEKGSCQFDQGSLTVGEGSVQSTSLY